jgi:hypothetical protein
MKYILKNKLKQEKYRFHIFKIIHKKKKEFLMSNSKNGEIRKSKSKKHENVYNIIKKICFKK